MWVDIISILLLRAWCTADVSSVSPSSEQIRSLLVSCSFTLQYLLCFVRGLGQRTKELENITKKLESFVATLALSTIILSSMVCSTPLNFE